MSQRSLSALFVLTVGLHACTKVDTGPDFVASIAFDSLPYPSVILGDVMRDSNGVSSAVKAFAYNFSGDEVTTAPIRYYALDRGVTVDSVTGAVRGDSLRDTPVRIVASVNNLQSSPRNVDITLRPDTVFRVKDADTLVYSKLDTANYSVPLQVHVQNRNGTTLTNVKSYLVSFAIVGVGDTLASLVNESRKLSNLDTTDASGIAGRSIKLRSIRLTATNDSIIVNATVKYLGTAVSGSPVRLVLRVKP